MNATKEDLVPGEMAVPLEPLIRALQPRAVKDYDFWIVFLCFFFASYVAQTSEATI